MISFSSMCVFICDKFIPNDGFTYLLRKLNFKVFMFCVLVNRPRQNSWLALCCDARAPSWTLGFGIVNSTALHCIIIFLGPIMGIPLGLGGLPPENSNGRKATWAMCPQETLRQEVILVQHGLVLPKFKRWREFLGILRNPGMSMDAGRLIPSHVIPLLPN